MLKSGRYLFLFTIDPIKNCQGHANLWDRFQILSLLDLTPKSFGELGYWLTSTKLGIYLWS